LIEVYRQRFGEHIPLIRRQDVKGFMVRRPSWFTAALAPGRAREEAALMEIEARRFYEAAAQRTTDAGIRQLLDDLAREEQRHETTAEEITDAQAASGARNKSKGMLVRLSFISPRKKSRRSKASKSVSRRCRPELLPIQFAKSAIIRKREHGQPLRSHRQIFLTPSSCHVCRERSFGHEHERDTRKTKLGIARCARTAADSGIR
jgi:rubrerythrin